MLSIAGPVLATVPTIDCGELGAFAKTAPANAVVTIRGSCEMVEIANRTVPLTVQAFGPEGTPLIKGLTLRKVENLLWRGGIVEAAGGRDASEWYLQRGLNVIGGRNLVFEHVHFRNAHRAIVVSETEGFTVRNSNFRGLRSDGVNLVTVDGAVVENNRFFEMKPRPTQCTFSDGTVALGLSNGQCNTRGGTWRDGDHPDCVQIWGTPANVRVEGNRIETAGGGACMGITTHGITLGRNISFVGNLVRVDMPTGIRMAKCEDCVIRENVVERATPTMNVATGITLGSGNVGLVACNNVVPDPRRPDGTQPCML
jgi:hypothetical protein